MNFKFAGLLLAAALITGCANTQQDVVSQLVPDSYGLAVQGEYQQSERLLVKGLEAEPNNVWLLLNMGALLHRTGRFEQAYDHYKRVIAVDPNGELYGRANNVSAPGFEGRTAAELAQDNMDNLPAGIVQR